MHSCFKCGAKIEGGFPISKFQMDEMDAFMRERFPEDYFMEKWPKWIRKIALHFVKQKPVYSVWGELVGLRKTPKPPARHLNSAIGYIHDYCDKNNLDFKAVMQFSDIDLHKELK